MAFQSSREGQLTEENLNRGYWWTLHKVQVRQGFSIFLAVIDFALVGYAAFGFADYYFGSGVAERRGIAEMSRPAIDYVFFHQQNAPVDLVIEPAQIIPSGQGSYDYIARAENPNPRWIAHFKYHFVSIGAETPVQRGYLLPGESRWLDALGIRSEAVPAGASIVIEDVAWERLDQHKTRPDYQTWASLRLNFAIEDLVFVPPLPEEVIAASRARFKVTNDTGFSYREVSFFVTLISGSRVVGANRVAVSNLRGGETREVEVTWFNDLPSVARVEVQPLVDIFDEQVYLVPGQ